MNKRHIKWQQGLKTKHVENCGFKTFSSLQGMKKSVMIRLGVFEKGSVQASYSTFFPGSAQREGEDWEETETQRDLTSVYSSCSFLARPSDSFHFPSLTDPPNKCSDIGPKTGNIENRKKWGLEESNVSSPLYIVILSFVLPSLSFIIIIAQWSVLEYLLWKAPTRLLTWMKA